MNIVTIETPLGPMIAMADEKALHLLEFLDHKHLNDKQTWLLKHTQSYMIEANNTVLNLIQSELEAYFARKLVQFTTPIQLLGTPFQVQVWNTLRSIPYGQTLSYQAEAQHMNRPNAYRAVANANGANRLSIIVPCHRVIRMNKNLGGYGGGIHRKEWLLAHEKAM